MTGKSKNMNLKCILCVSILIMIMSLFSGCKKEEFSWGQKVGDITYSGNAVILGDKELSLIKEITPNKIIFSNKSGAIEKITDMSILVMGISGKTPYGSLRKVNTIETNGTEVVVTTSDAKLTDAVKEGTIILQEKLLEKNFTLKSKVDGVVVKGPNKSFDGLAVTLDKFEIYRDGAIFSRLSGSVGISPVIDITIKIKSNSIKEISIISTITKIDEVTVTSNGAFSGGKEITVAEFIHSPIIINSLVFVPEVVIVCGFDGAVSCEVTSGVRQDRTITSGFSFKNSYWLENSLSHTETFDFIKPQVIDNSDIKIFSGPEINILLFGTPIQTLKSIGFFSLKAEKNSSPFWRLFIGDEGINSIKADMMGTAADYVSNISVQTSEIGNAESK
jgi:hypothetical protein